MNTHQQGLISKANRGFTLLELLVVVGILALVATIVGWARWGESPHARVSAGQRTLLAVLRNVQQQAQSEGGIMGVLVHADTSNPERYYRLLVPARLTSTGWQTIGQAILLPRGIWVVPDDASSTPDEGWVPELRSLFSNGNQKVLVDVVGRGSSWFQVFAVGPDGRPDSLVREDYLLEDMPGGLAANQRLNLSPGRRSGREDNPVQWILPGATAGLEFMRNGTLVMR